MSHPRLAAAYLAEQERLGCIPPAWRFARGGARVNYWGLPGADRPMMIDVIVDDDAGGVRELLAASLAALRLAVVDYLADRPPGGERSLVTEPLALEALGFALIAMQVRLEHTAEVGGGELAGIAIRPAAELSEPALCGLLGAVHSVSLDRATRDRDPAADLAGLRALDHDPAWWEVAFDGATPIGFVMPTRTPEGAAVIGFIGVTPAARGRGIGRALLARGTATLRRDPAVTRVIADVDAGNAAMRRAAAAVGYVELATRAHYRLGRR